MDRPEPIVGSTHNMTIYVEWLEAELKQLRAAAQAVLRCPMGEEINRLRELLDREIVYQTEDEIPVDRAGRKMYNKFGDKLDIGERS
jgi:hypothetical protein